MDNCVQVRASLDVLTAAEFDSAGPERDHLRVCPECQHWVAQSCRFDRDVREALNNTAVPPDLESRLLAAILETAPRVPQSETRVSSGFWRWTVAALLVLGLSGWWLVPVPNVSPSFEFADLQLRLQQGLAEEGEFGQSGAVNGLDFAAVERDLIRLRLVEPRGLQLDGVAGSDAVSFRFHFRKWSGTVVAVPSHRLTNGPVAKVPPRDSRQRTLAWKSSDGAWTYVCLVESGPTEGFTQALFGGLA